MCQLEILNQLFPDELKDSAKEAAQFALLPSFNQFEFRKSYRGAPSTPMFGRDAMRSGIPKE